MSSIVDIGALLLWIAVIIFGLTEVSSIHHLLLSNLERSRPIHYLYATTISVTLFLLSSSVLLSIGISSAFSTLNSFGFRFVLMFLVIENVFFLIAAVGYFIAGARKLKHEL